MLLIFKLIYILSIIIFILKLVVFPLNAQPKPTKQKPANYGISSKKALSYYEAGIQSIGFRAFQEAVQPLKTAINLEPEFAAAHYNLGYTLYKLNKPTEAIPHLEKAVQKDPKTYAPAQFYLGLCYIHQLNYAQAETNLKAALSQNTLSPQDKALAERNLVHATFAKDAIKNKTAFNPINLGQHINTSGEEYMPTLTADDTQLFFTTRRAEVIGGYNPTLRGFGEDLFFSKQLKSGWAPSQNLGEPVNTPHNEGAACFTQDGHGVYFTACERKDGFGRCDIYYANLNGGAWSVPENIGAVVNSRYLESHPFISHDGQKLYFVSDRPGGLGGMDIWVATNTSRGWSTPVNLGAPINTPGNERYPVLHADGSTLYFSSDTHPGFGGLDVFVSRLKNGRWDNPVNAGYPLNTPGDEHGVFINTTATQGYISSERAGGFGGMDIYSFVPDKTLQPQPVTWIRGQVLDSITGQKLQAKVTLIDLATYDTIRTLFSSAQTGDFILSVPVGKSFGAYVERKGYLFYSANFSPEKAHIQTPFTFVMKLQPLMAGAKVVLNNVFFDKDSDVIKPESAIELDKLLKLVQANPTMLIELSGHTDSDGSAEYNRKLSQKRADAVRHWLIQRQVVPSRIDAIGYGQTMPIAPNTTPEGKAKNRRTELKVLELKP